jgi:hypothetical protein
VSAPGAGQLDALDMARNLAASVQRAAERIEADELGAYLNRTGDTAFAGAQMASYLALVSIAGDLRRITDVLCGADTALGPAGP